MVNMKSAREQQLIQLAEAEIEKNQAIVNADPYRLRYHLMPPVGLMNDPNGFIHWRGTYHVFYQWMPFKTGHGAKFWGHYSSADLVHWRHEKIALAPSEWFDKDGCYSGSAIDHNGTLTLFYTGNVKDEKGERSTYQCMAVSENGTDFTKKGVVLELPSGYTAHFRDPKVWKKDDVWYMIVGAQSENLDGKAVLFRSKDLTNWEHLGAIAGGHDGDFGYMWECPDLFELDGKDVLIVCPQGLKPNGMLYNNVYQSGYFVGELDYNNIQYVHGDFTELDRGFEFYAPQTTVDAKGRRLLIAWMGVPDQYEDKHPTIAYKWIHALTIPRELELVNGKLHQRPVEELKQLRREEVVYPNVALMSETKQFSNVSGQSVELLLERIDGRGILTIHIRDNAKFLYDYENGIATLERKSFVDGQVEKRQCQLNELRTLRMFLDTSSVEIFLNDGEEVFTARIFPDSNNEQIIFQANDRISFDLKKWKLC
jgi:beta-fructofuranosidase